MANKSVAETLTETYMRLIREMGNDEECRPDWAAYVKGQFARCSYDPHVQAAGPLQAPAQTRLRLAYVNAYAPRHQQPEPDCAATCPRLMLAWSRE